ncbi:uncharacterized protein [Dysidea avara]|uniref:uncharacterized protein n=1 Tax=Dysidea avara TaxID=196820 RepID=UPI00331DE1C5
MTLSVGDQGGTSSHYKIFANIFISFIGAGILGLPFAFKEAGLYEGIIVMTLVGFFSVKAMLVLIDCRAKIINDATGSGKVLSPTTMDSAIDYGEVGFYAIGPAGKWLVEVSIIVSQLGFCCAYLIFISENLHNLLSLDFPSLTKMHYLWIIIVPLIFLANLRQLGSLGTFSIFAQMANGFALSVVFWFDMKHHHLIKTHIKTVSFDGLPFFIAFSTCCFEGAGLVLSLESSVVPEMRNTFRRMFKIALVVITGLYLMFGICGYLSFGPETASMITLNLPQDIFPSVVIGCLCFSLFFTYPVMMFPVSKIIDKMLCYPSTGGATDHALSTIMRTCLVFLTAVIVTQIPNFSNMMALVGSTCCVLLGFVLPGLFHWKLFSRETKGVTMVIDILLIVVGIIAGIVGLDDAVKRIWVNSANDTISGT